MLTLHSIGQGLLTGIVLSMMLGTVFFSLIRNSIASGVRTGIYIASGVIICDIMFIALALLSSGFAVFLKEYQQTISIVGGVILILMGVWMFVHSKPKSMEGKAFKTNQVNPWYYIGNGFLLNVLNPVNFFSWLAISSVLTIEYNYSINLQLSFFFSCLLAIFGMEIGISFSASKLKKWMNEKIIQRINQISALVFIAIGIRLLFA
ncbi:MAG: LysE family transporter [Bacteroidia bacterium]